MARKNRNARRPQNGNYSSFDQLMNANSPFDLAKGQWLTKQNKRVVTDDDVSLHINTDPTKKRTYLHFSVSKAFAEKISPYVRVGIVNNGYTERLYFIKERDIHGYKVSQSERTPRCYIKIIVDNDFVSRYEKYEGTQDAKYDADNDCYYIVPQV